MPFPGTSYKPWPLNIFYSWLHIIQLPFFRVFENPLGVDSDTSDRQRALLSTSGHSSGNSSGSDDWIEPAAYVLNSTALLSREHRNVLDAFRLLQKDPTVQV
jgi:hypothetical protein